MALAERLRQLTVQADDIPLSLTVQQQLRKLGMRTEIIEPENNPDFPGIDPQELKRANAWYETVIGFKDNLVVQISVYPNHTLWPTVGIYRRWRRGKDNWANLLRQYSSPHSLKWQSVQQIIQALLPSADQPKVILEQLVKFNQKLHWVKTRSQQVTAAGPGKPDAR